MATQTTPEQATSEQATAAPKRTPRPKAAANPKASPNTLFVTDQIVWAGHPRLHEQVTEAKILSDFHISSTYVRLAWLDDGQVALVHRNRVSADKPEPTAAPKAA